MAVSDLTADADHPAGLYVADASGAGTRMVAAGNFDFPTWHPDGQRIAVVETGSGGGPDRIVLVSLDGTQELVMNVDAGERIGRIAINPLDLSPIEVAYELVLPPPPGEGGDAAIFIETYSEAGGRQRWTGGGAQMSDEPYSADGRLTYYESGQVIYQDADLEPQVHNEGSFAEPEWGPDGFLAYQTNDGIVAQQIGDPPPPPPPPPEPATVVGPGSFGETDWYPTAPGQAPQLVLTVSAGSEIRSVGGDPAVLGGVGGTDPDVSPAGRFLATRFGFADPVIAVYDAQTFAAVGTIDVPAARFAYPPVLFDAPAD